MIGRVITVSKIDGIVQGIISSQDGREYPFSNPSVYVRPGFIIEFDIIELDGKEYARLIRQAEIEYPKLSNEIVQDIIAEVNAIVEKKGFLTAVEFSQLLKDNGIQDVKTYAKNMTCFIAKYLTPKYTSRSDVRVNGKICPCAIVSVEADANLSFGESSMSSQSLDDDTMRKVISVLTQHIREHGYIKGAYLPKLLKKAGIDDFHQYADSVASFVVLYFNNQFKVEKNIQIDGKIQPCIVTLKEATSEIDTVAVDNLKAELMIIIEEKGCADINLLTQLFKKHNINAFKIAHNLSSFIMKELKELIIVEDVIINETYYKRVLIKKGATNYTRLQEYDGELIIPPTIIDNISNSIANIINAERFVYSSKLPAIFKECGITNFRIYASSIEMFIQRYLPQYKLIKNVIINGKKLPGIVINVESSVEALNLNRVDSEGTNNQNSIVNHNASVLDNLFINGLYGEFLSSPEFISIQPQDLSLELLEKALTCAHRLLYPDSKDIITLNSFQKEVYYNRTSADFIAKWKKDGTFDPCIIEQCAESAMACFVYPTDKALVVKLINKIGYVKTLNNNYVGITTRFMLCENQLTPHFYIIRAFVQNSHSSICNIISEYCQFVKDNKHTTSGSRMTDMIRMFHLPDLLKTIDYQVRRLCDLPRNLKTNIVSTFVEYGFMNEIAEIIGLWDEEHISVDWKTINLYFESEKWTEQDVIILINEGISLQLLQRCVSLIWAKFDYENTLPKYFLDLLAWVAIHTGWTSLDEILRYSIKGLSRINKSNMLMDNIQAIFDYCSNDPQIYVLASYIVLMMAPEMDPERFPEQTKSLLNEWQVFSDSFYIQLLEQSDILYSNDPNCFSKLFRIFQLDETHYYQLQNYHANHFMDRIISVHASSALDYLYQQGAYISFIKLYEDTYNYEAKESEEYLYKYIDALICLHKYSEAIDLITNNQIMLKAKQNELIIKAISENFRFNALSPKAYSCFGGSLSLHDAIDLLLTKMNGTTLGIINSLIAIYIHNGSYLKAAYLYVIFRSRAEKGYSRLYLQMRQNFSKYIDFNKIVSRYHVVALAFESLNMYELLDYLKWANRIMVPDFKGYSEGHVFQKFFDNLILDSENVEYWQRFLAHISRKGIEKNAWYMIVCDTVIRRLTSKNQSLYAQNSINYILDYVNPNLFPPAFFVYVFYFIEDYQSDVLCYKVLDLVSKSNTNPILLTDNIWSTSFQSDIKDFKQYCLKAYDETNNIVFHKIISSLGLNLDGDEVEIIARTIEHRVPILTKMFSEYLNGNGTKLTHGLISNLGWDEATELEKQLLNLLDIIYDSDESLLENRPDLFHNEDEVSRFKTDCAKILCEYPNKDGLFNFDRSCCNDSYKMVVYSFVFNVLYDHDLYTTLDDRYYRDYINYVNTPLYSIYLNMLKTAYKAQLIHNTTFPYFYKKWRYYKLYLVNILIHDGEYDDSSIVELMKQNDHYDDIYIQFYLPFVQSVREFLSFEVLPSEVKQHFLFSVMVSHAADFFIKCKQYLYNLSSEQQLVCRKINSYLDYRFISLNLFNYIDKEDVSGYTKETIKIAQAISIHTYNALSNTLCADQTELKIFRKYALTGKPSQVLTGIIQMDFKLFEKYKHILVPVLCARQFVFHINDRFRSILIRNRSKQLCEKYRYISQYLEANGEPNASYVYHYFCALLACLESDRNSAQKMIEGIDWNDYIPVSWLGESQRIIEFANGVIERFKPDNGIKDGSYDVRKADKNLIEEKNFAEVLLLKYENEHTQIETKEQAESLLEEYLTTAESWEKAFVGLSLIVWLKDQKKTDINDVFPSIEELLIDNALILLQSNINLPIEEQLLVITDIYKNRERYSQKEYSTRFETIKSLFMTLITNGFSLPIWIKSSSIIESFLRESQALLDFVELRKRIIDKCKELCSPDLSYDEIEHEYTILINSFAGLTSHYSKNVMKSIISELKALEGRIRLSIEIENNKVTNGKVYFLIRNCGRRSVSLDKDNLFIVVQQEDQPENDEITIMGMYDLQSGSMTGCYANIMIPAFASSSAIRIIIRKRITDTLYETVCFSEAVISQAEPNRIDIPLDARYDVTSAITDESMLFGRDNEKHILEKCIPAGVTLIYGPSRIGKTSLMNWIRNTLAINKGNIATVLIGGENGLGKDSDYERNILDRSIPIPFDNDLEMSRYLLIDTLIFGLTERDRLGSPGSVSFSSDLVQQLLHVLKDDALSIKAKYYEINELLREAKIELWLLLDEFQQVVERWDSPSAGSDFVEVCNLLSSKERNKPSNIKIIICGSDDLLKHMTLEQNSVWKNTFKTTLPVEALKSEEDFSRMIEQDEAVVDTNIAFSVQAKATLFSYTGGVALYGKEICNVILDDIRSAPDKWSGRTVVYSSDISEATQKLLNQQDAELSIKSKEGISEVYAAVTKRLDFCTEQMLYYMAKWLSENTVQDGFPESAFTENELNTEFRAALHDSLRIAEARGILKKIKSHYDNAIVYCFRTVFYFFAFLGNSKNSLSEDFIWGQGEYLHSSDSVQPSVPSVLEQYEMLSPQQKFEILKHAYDDQTIPSEMISEWRKRHGNLISAKNYVEENSGNVAGNQTIIQTNISIIVSETVKKLHDTILYGRKNGLQTDEIVDIFRKNIGAIPSLTPIDDMPDVTKEIKAELLESSDRDETYCEQLSDGVIKSGIDLIEWVERGEGADFLFTYGVTIKGQSIVVGTEQHIYDEKHYNSIIVGFYLRWLFKRISDFSTDVISDYSPSSIMFCKTIERLLKEKHLPLYQNPAIWLNKVLSNGSKPSVVKFPQKATIGTFTTAMATMFEISATDTEAALKRQNRDSFLSHTHALESDWFQYYQKMKNVLDVRNKTAHSNQVSQPECDEVIRALFKDNLLSHTVDFV